jgi:hypothetical protein
LAAGLGLVVMLVLCMLEWCCWTRALKTDTLGLGMVLVVLMY